MPQRVAGFVGSVGEHDHAGSAALQVGRQHGFVPLQQKRGFGAIDAEGFVGDAGGFIGHPAEDAHGTCIQRLQQEAMRPRLRRVADEARGQLAFGGNFVEQLVVIVERQPAAERLLQKVDLQAVAFGFEEDGPAGARGVDGDAAQAEPAIAGAGAQSRAHPAGGGAATGIEAAIARERMPGQRETGAAIAEALAELLAQAAGPFVGRGMGIAELEDVDGRPVFGGAEADQLFEEGHQRAGLLERLPRRADEILLDFA